MALAVAAKDVSQAGLVGTVTMLCESSAVGAMIDLDAVPAPPNVEEFKWLTTFPSFGFILACERATVPALLQHFQQAGVSAAAIGHFDDTRQVCITRSHASAAVWDLALTPLTGFGGAQRQYEEAS